MQFAIVIIAIVVIVVLAVIYVSIRNGIVRADNRCDNAWQTIAAQLQRRYDLIPNLVDTVKGYAQHESATFEAVTNARTSAAQAQTPQETMQANDQLTQALTHLFAVAEAYPTLRASENFQQLQTELRDTEDKIAWARQSYNDCVQKYNDAIETFPGSFIAGSSFAPRVGFEASEASQEAPRVSF